MADVSVNPADLQQPVPGLNFVPGDPASQMPHGWAVPVTRNKRKKTK
eukprot:CAMPEP_0114540552 /NCGR_PEP_ID=MMETSP0114-20121206/831_1 /TAXON_ID=31324 /ORGANISM="Goniomonas sp, Strain m" /LENGTH=46 /DNA_ID= /DNA_START= /DNA_END= /DNA_ORIENTATION=